MNLHFVNTGRILTNVEHFDGRRAQVDDFFILDVNHGFAAQLLGALYVEAESMMNLLKWADESFGDYKLLISIDGKFGAVLPVDEVEFPKGDSKLLTLQDSFDSQLGKIKSNFRKYLENNSELAEQLNLRSFQQAVPDRIKFLAEARFGPGSVTSDVEQGLRNIEGASDDSLVWIHMLGVTGKLGINQNILDAVRSELSMRIEKASEFRSTFFPLSELSMREIEARGIRANRGLQTFRAKFPNEPELDPEQLHSETRRNAIERFCQRLSNDRLVELCVFIYNKEDWLGESFKLVAIEFERRARIAGD